MDPVTAIFTRGNLSRTCSVGVDIGRQVVGRGRPDGCLRGCGIS